MIGYKRLNKSVGIRNYVLIMSAADNVNPLAKKISSQIKNSIYLPASYGRGQLGVDHNNFLTCMAGLADNPNIFKTIIVSMEHCRNTHIIAIMCSGLVCAKYVLLIFLLFYLKLF